MRKSWLIPAIALSLFFAFHPVSKGETEPSGRVFRAMRWRFIGPFRGGRVTAVTGVPHQPLVYYMGATGGGVWKTEDGGVTWQPLSDKFFGTGSVGAVAVAPSDPNVIYVGTGEACLRNDISHGDGVYKSVDGGATWVHLGLRDSRHIARIRVHPENPDLVYVAALGHVFGPHEQRGVFRSRDGGKTWEKILYLDERTGAADLAMDPTNPRILYATMWQVEHRPWGIFSGGPGSGLYKTTDGGDTWSELTDGLPKGEKGRIGVTVSPVNHRRVWALIEAEKGGVYRSDNGGRSWRRLSDSIQVRRRAPYYSHIFADTEDEDTVYVLTSPFLKSIDGGTTFHPIRVPHGDTHDLWVAPEDHGRIVLGSDGGACITFNGGKSWSRLNNQPTAQIYMVTTDHQLPYRIYGAQQDDTTISIPSRTTSFGVGQGDWYSVGGGESGYIAPDPRDPNIVYAGSFWGFLTRYDHRTGEVQNVQIWPEIPGGQIAARWTYRFNWTFPLLMSPHDPSRLYAAANVVFISTDEGRSWTEISGDLTRNDRKKQGQRLTEIYCTIVSLVESPLEKGLLWAGSDDGLVHLTRTGGNRWLDVTPPGMKPWSRVNIIEASPHDPATAYLAVERHKLDDYTPTIYKTTDYGKTWRLITHGIPVGTFVRTVREDPNRKGLLYAGTETGVYVSFDGGEHWQSLQLNLPIVPVADLAVKDGDLVAATHGRGFWVLDDVTPLEQTAPEVLAAPIHLFRPREAYRLGFSRRRLTGPYAKNPPRGVIIDYYLKEKPAGEVKLEFLDAAGKLIKAFSSRAESGSPRLTALPGVNRFVWDMRYPDAIGIEGGTHLFGGSLRGPVAVPGSYQVRLSTGEGSFTESFEIKKDPRLSTTQEAYQRQFDFLIQVRDKLSAAHAAVNEIGKLQRQLKDAARRAEHVNKHSPLAANIRELDRRMTNIRNQIVELRFTGVDDQMLRYPVRLNVKLGFLQSVAAGAERAPTAQARAVFRKLSHELEMLLSRWGEMRRKDVPQLNRLARQQGVPLIVVQ